jgi:hypothetical protein
MLPNSEAKILLIFEFRRKMSLPVITTHENVLQTLKSRSFFPPLNQRDVKKALWKKILSLSSKKTEPKIIQLSLQREEKKSRESQPEQLNEKIFNFNFFFRLLISANGVYKSWNDERMKYIKFNFFCRSVYVHGKQE